MTADFYCGCEVELSVDSEALPARYSVESAEAALEGLTLLLESGAAA